MILTVDLTDKCEVRSAIALLSGMADDIQSSEPIRNEADSLLMIRAGDEIYRLRSICQQVHDRLLRGDSDKELLVLLDMANAENPR